MRRDTMQAYGVIAGIALFIIVMLIYFLFFRSPGSQAADLPKIVSENSSSASPESSKGTDKKNTDSAADAKPAEPAADADEPSEDSSKAEHSIEVKEGITYIDGVLIVNKTYSLPSDYNPGINADAKKAFDEMASAAWADNIGLFICSGFRSYQEQETVYNGYAANRGTEEADKVSSRPGHSEHQSGLAMDVNTTDFSFEGTPEAIWIEQHCADYGFIIRFPKGKEDITGYEYEPWHIRYVGKELAHTLMDNGLCLEEYFGITSKYA